MAAESGTKEASSNGNTTTLSPDVEKKIVRQVEYYFGNKNFPRDKFLRQKAEEDDGWVTLECLTTFNRLKALSTDTEAIAKVLKAHSDAGLIEVSEDNKKVRRLPSVALPVDSEEVRLEAKRRSVYCKGFPKDITMDALDEFFGAHGKVMHIFMRRHADRSFKGSVFVEFEKIEDKNKFLSIEHLKYKEEELIKMSKGDYYKKKNEEYQQSKMDKNSKKKKGEEKKTTEGEKKGKPVKEQEPLMVIKGCVLHIEGISEQTSREDLKEIFGGHEEIAWVDYAKGQSEGQIRFSKEGGAQRAVDAVKKANDGKILIRDTEPTFRILEGEEEENYWKKANEDRSKAWQKKSQGGRKGHGFGGRGQWNRKGRRDRTEESSGATPAKKAKVEATDAKAEAGGEDKAGSHMRFEDASE